MVRLMDGLTIGEGSKSRLPNGEGDRPRQSCEYEQTYGDLHHVDERRERLRDARDEACEIGSCYEQRDGEHGRRKTGNGSVTGEGSNVHGRVSSTRPKCFVHRQGVSPELTNYHLPRHGVDVAMGSEHQRAMT